jgi:hypothetical protein
MNKYVITIACAGLISCSGDTAGSGDEDTENNGAPGPEKTTTTVGRDGGIATLGDASLTIQPGALLGDVEIGIEKLVPPPLDVLPGYQYIGEAYAFTPHGTQFIKTVRVRVPYVVEEEDRLGLHRLDDESDQSWEVLDEGDFQGGIASYDTLRLSVFIATQEDPCSEDTAPTWYRDDDGDNYGDDGDTQVVCRRPPGYAGRGGDCDDSSSRFNPGAVEEDCTDDTDYNCDGETAYEDFDADGTPACEDCNDQRSDIGACPSGTTCEDGGCE